MQSPWTIITSKILTSFGTDEQSKERAVQVAARRWALYGADLSVLVAAFLFAYLLRFDFQIPLHERASMLVQVPLVLVIQVGALALFGVYRFIPHYISTTEVPAFIRSAFLSGLLIVGLRLGLPVIHQGWPEEFDVPLSVAAIDTVLAFGGLLGLRFLKRLNHERKQKVIHAHNGHNGSLKTVLLIGAVEHGMLAAREIHARPDMGLEVKGLVDDDPAKTGARVYGLRVLGTSQDLPKLVDDLAIDHVVITLTDASRRELRRLVRLCEAIPIKARILPGLDEILGGKVQFTHIRDIEIEDLLGREPVRLDISEMHRFITGKVVMVTGAGGSIGSELARQVARFAPSVLLLVERAEFGLFEINRELGATWPKLTTLPLIADVGDVPRVRDLFSRYHPHVVLHAAAHKHVPLMESNLVEAVKNNVLATFRLGRIAGESGAEVFVLISTDKAVRPASAMGASKRVAELVVQHLNRDFATHFAAVRFGNVIGSSGSVIPLFREQIRKGGPVTVTHPDMVRYFMTIPEAAQLVLQASAMTRGGEIFILDMGEPVRIVDLARDIIRLSGLKPDEDIAIVWSGLRPGEKLFEELETTGEHLVRTAHPKIFVCKIAAYPAERSRAALRELAQLANRGEASELRRYLNELLPEAHLESVETDARPALNKTLIKAAGA
jgi:FlaA1/EpsC-like NDP-sugar epimerase